MSNLATDKPSDADVVPKNEPDSIFDTKLFRLLTVGFYIAAVGGMGFMLSVFFLFIWDSRMPPLPEIHHTHHNIHGG